jgi:hypothetical protein
VSAWRRYLRWNKAIADQLFGEGSAGQPVYLDMEDEVIEALGKSLGVEVDDAKPAFVDAVRATLNISCRDGNLFGAHVERTRTWIPGRDAPPPSLGLLALLGLAAGGMRASEGIAAHNYYGRLAPLIGIGDAGLHRLQEEYRFCAERLWGSLNEWLEVCEGERGLPTAFSLHHRYVGLPMSQALVRSHDRRKFRNMFAEYGLPAGYQFSPPDMQRLLDPWILRTPSPVSGGLRVVWERDPVARDRIAAVASIELEAWDGTLAAAQHANVKAEVRVVALLRTFMGQRLELTASVTGNLNTSPRTLELVDPVSGQRHPAEFSPAPDGSLRLSEPDLLEAGSLLTARLEVHDPAVASVATRQPRRLVPLRKDDMLQAFVEAERVQLGEDTMLLCKVELGEAVDVALSKVARPGWQRLDSVAGLPENWSLFKDVQVLSVLDMTGVRVELTVLVPLATSQLTLAEGIQLPGRMRKWSSLHAPEVRALSERAESITVALEQVRALTDDPPVEPRRWKSDGAAIVVSLDQEALP